MPLKNREILNIHPERKVALGVFDGVHVGHQELLKRSTLVMTFNPHPQVVTNSYVNPVKLLSTLDEKQSLVPNLIVLNFSNEIANYTPRQFVKKILVDELSVDTVIVGYDYAFGKGRKGTVKDLISFGEEFGYRVEIVDKVTIDNEIVKSSYIRKLISAGNIARANQFLGRNYFVFGQVVSGKQLGRTIGFPTVNIMVSPGKLLPKLGVYYGRIRIDDNIYDCAVNIGFENKEILLEAHIFDFSRDVYGKKVSIEFVSFIREEKAFSDFDQLKKQIEVDIVKIKEMISK